MSSGLIMYDLETAILQLIAEYLVGGNMDTPAADWRLGRLSAFGAMNSDIEKIIHKNKTAIIKSVNKELDSTVENVFRELRSAVPGTVTRTALIQRTIETHEKIALDRIGRGIETLAEKAGNHYAYSVNKASMAVSTGESTLSAAVKRAVTETAGTTLPPYIDKKGRMWSPEAYTNMSVRTEQRHIATETMFNAGDQLGTDLIQVSSHMGARPGCEPYQGKIYSRNSEHPDYDNLYTDTSYGEAAGLNGINCGHFFYPFIEGVSEKTFKEYPKKENKKRYEESQQQRANERKIRAAKRHEKIERSGGNADKAAYYKQRTKELQAEQREFIKRTGRTRRYEREQIYS